MAKLGDLNVSKITTRGLGYTQTGTPYYASPEVWKDKPYNLKSDIWSLGCVFYELIMLTTPFKAKSMKDLFIKVKKGEYPPIYNTFSPKFQIVIDNILRVKPEERPNTEDILNMPEIVDKIEELNIFKNDNDKKHDFNSDINKFLLTTNYKINNRNNYILNEENKNENITLSKIFENRIKNNQVKRGKEKNLNINNSIELKNNKKYFNLQKKYEIVNIYNNNINYFRKLFNSKKKIVIKTIKYPKKFKDLNKENPRKSSHKNLL
jgi:NIMA (never in mitosis gene a)-related kinase